MNKTSHAIAIGGIIFRIIKYLVVAFVIILPVRWFVAQPFIVSGNSMTPAFTANEYVIIDKIAYHFDKPQRDDIIVFHYPLDASVYFIKRIIGLPGETVDVENNSVTVTGKEGTRRLLNEPYVLSPASKKQSIVTTLAADEYFVLGDNRDVSSDSREWGPLQEKFIIGRVLTNPFHLRDYGFLSGIRGLTAR